MQRRFALLAVLGILGCASDTTSRWDIDSTAGQEAPRVAGTKHAEVIAAAEGVAPAEVVAPAKVVAPAESTPAERVSGADSVAIESPASVDADGSDLADAIVQGSYPPPQSSPPPQGGNPPPKVVYVQQPPPNVVYVQQPPPPPPPPPFARTRVTLKGGYYSVDDTKRLDDGYIIEATFMNFFTPNFATEAEIGYVDASGKKNGVESDLWGIPFLINARVCLPVKTLELYGGGGIGSIYYDVSVDPGADVSGWVAAADAFFGAALKLKSGLVIGVEAKYYFTESVHSLDGGLDSFAGMLTVGIAR